MNSNPSDEAARQRLDEFMGLLVRFQRPLYQRILMFLGSSGDAEDVMQDTVMAAWKDFDKYEADSNFFAWITQIAYHRVLKLRREQSRGLSLLDAEVLDLLASEAADEPIHALAPHELLHQCLEKLPAADRQLVENRYQSGMTGEALAAQLGRPRNSVYKSLGRIRRALLECLQRQANSSSS